MSHVKVSRRNKKSSQSSQSTPPPNLQDIIGKLVEWFVHFTCKSVPNVVLYEPKKQNDSLDTHKEPKTPKIALGISTADKVIGQVNKVICTNFVMESATILAMQKFAEEITFNVTVLTLENCSLTADHIRSLALLFGKRKSLEELSLNGNPNDEQNHYLLLQFPRLWSCSLKFCGIDKEGVKKIAEEVVGSKSIIHLNLAGNNLFDEGMEPLSNMLRVNRTLLNLNLTDNKIRNEGCIKLMEVFKLFVMSYEEVVLRRRMIFDYFKQKLLKNASVIPESEQTERKSKSSLRKTNKEKISLKSSKLYRKQTIGALIEREIDYHPFIHDTVEIGPDIFCRGNNVLFSLNLSFNQIGLIGLTCIEKVIGYQKTHYGIRGLTRLVLNGNITTEECRHKIEKLEAALSREIKKSFEDWGKKSTVKIRKQSRFK